MNGYDNWLLAPMDRMMADEAAAEQAFEDVLDTVGDFATTLDEIMQACDSAPTDYLAASLFRAAMIEALQTDEAKRALDGDNDVYLAEMLDPETGEEYASDRYGYMHDQVADGVYANALVAAGERCEFGYGDIMPYFAKQLKTRMAA